MAEISFLEMYKVVDVNILVKDYAMNNENKKYVLDNSKNKTQLYQISMIMKIVLSFFSSTFVNKKKCLIGVRKCLQAVG